MQNKRGKVKKINDHVPKTSYIMCPFSVVFVALESYRSNLSNAAKISENRHIFARLQTH